MRILSGRGPGYFAKILRISPGEWAIRETRTGLSQKEYQKIMGAAESRPRPAPLKILVHGRPGILGKAGGPSDWWELPWELSEQEADFLLYGSHVTLVLLNDDNTVKIISTHGKNDAFSSKMDPAYFVSSSNCIDPDFGGYGGFMLPPLRFEDQLKPRFLV